MGSKNSPKIIDSSEVVSAAFSLQSILPNINQALDGTGFIFGAGASFEAGYPMMPALTKTVISALNSQERNVLDEVLTAAKKSYDANKGIPNIEELADLVIAHYVSTNLPRFNDLESKFRSLILENILAIDNPDLSNHVLFFEKLKARTYGQPCTVWMWTTNYDTLLEQAASIAGVQIENGFTGTIERYYTPEAFHKVSGSVGTGLIKRFTYDNQLVVKLIKLHGSISWFRNEGKLYERHPFAIPTDAERIMIMPRRRKVMDTLVPPYDSLFSLSTRILGNQCRYVASCGFSFCDDHINQHIFIPAINSAKCHLSLLSQCEPEGVGAMSHLPNFNGGYETHIRIKGQQIVGTTDLWKFSNFVNLF